VFSERTEMYSGVGLPWVVQDNYNGARVLDTTLKNGNIRDMAYTMYLGMIESIAASPSAQVLVTAGQLNLYRLHKSWGVGGAWGGFDAFAMFSHDVNVEALKAKQQCGGSAPTIIYGVANNSRLYQDAETHYTESVLKNAGTVISPGEVLIWKGLSQTHSIGKTLPTWSMNTRQGRQMFATWVLNSQAKSKIPTIPTIMLRSLC
jgi:hypothetical protein